MNLYPSAVHRAGLSVEILIPQKHFPLTKTFFLALFFLFSSLNTSAEEYVFLNPHEHVMRIAMDLTGGRPSEEDFAIAESNLDSVINRYMQTPEFSEQMMWLANDIFLVRTDFVEYFRDSYEYDRREVRYQVAKAVGEEPLRLFDYIVRNDRPITELVTADYTVANATLAMFWNIDYPGEYGSDQWLRGRYLDGRQHAGVLSQTSFFYRYNNTITNKNRHRANNVTRMFLGDDHLLRNVGSELRIADPEQDLLDLTLSNPACLACHSSLDGIGAHFNGFAIGPSRHSEYARENFANYSQQGVERSQYVLGRDPSYYGYPSNGLKDLGQYIAKDSRFARTMASHFYRFLVHRDLDYTDRDLLTQLVNQLQTTNFSPKQLIKSIVLSDEYRSAGVMGGSKGKSDPVESKTVPVRQDPAVSVWLDLEKSLEESKSKTPRIEEFIELAEFHAQMAGQALQQESITKGLPESKAQPFKVVTPEQLHFLGKSLVGEEWAGYEGGQSDPEVFPHLEYNTGVKVAAGGYDGSLILKRRWTVTPTFMLVLERWAEVLAEDIYRKELRNSVPWGERVVFKVITGKEDPIEAEPSIKRQIANWFLRFYGETVDPFGPEVQEIYDLLLTYSGRNQDQEKTDSQHVNTDVRVAWQHVLEVMLCDPRIATY
ncbi:MAG: DUF1585 domain-containing protein [Candidatus Omnitrophica bacterium]|nr:DUF1585 domain-containing protein [Candidatus Omnitrophota bacterium]